MDSAGPTSQMKLNAKSAMAANTFECPASELEPSKHVATVSENSFPEGHVESSALCNT